MYADRYAPRRVNRGSLSLSVAIVGSLVATVMLNSTTIRTAIGERSLPTYWVPTPPPPEPVPPPEPAPHTKAQPSPLPTEVLVPTPAPPKAEWVAPPDAPPVAPPGTDEGAGGGGAALVEPVKPPPPVLTGVEVDPRYAQHFQPIYPPAEQRAGRDGLVTIKVLVGVDGRVVRAEQLMATSEEFWRVTLKQALGRWRFKPATRDGVPYEAWRTMTVRFRLADQ